MAESKDTPAQAGKPIQGLQTSSIREVQTGNKPTQEGYQPLPLERKGYQPTGTPPPQNPPQSISGIFPFVETPPSTNGGVTTTAAPATPTQPQSANQTATETPQQSR